MAYPQADLDLASEVEAHAAPKAARESLAEFNRRIAVTATKRLSNEERSVLITQEVHTARMGGRGHASR